ncbi:hypothetical protein AB4189_26960, partial [Vibrio sp. 10N.286.49.E1]
SALRTFIYRQLRSETTQLELNKASSQKRWVEDSEALQQGREDKKVFIRLWKDLRILPSDQSMSPDGVTGKVNSRSIIGRLKVPKSLPDLKD